MNYHRSREFTRWNSADFRRPPGNIKQGGWHMYSGELDHGHGDGDGKYVRSRENQGSSYNQKDWKCHSWELNKGSPTPSLARPLEVINDRRPDDDMITCNPHPPHTGFANGWNQDHLKDQHNNKMSVVNEYGSNHKYGRENSLGSINKWTRSGSMSSRGSGYSHSNGLKSPGLDLNEAKAELQPRFASPSMSRSEDTVACETSVALCEETSPIKKPRLGWGEGLAKFEKKKVEGPDEPSSRDGVASPKVTVSSDFPSPTSPSSVACSSSQGMDNRQYVKESNTDNYTINSTDSPDSGCLNLLERLFLNLKDINIDEIASMGSSLDELFQSTDQNAFDDNFVRSNALKKLLILKGDISKTLEITESEIDSHEIDLQTLKSELENHCSPASPCSVTATSRASVVSIEGKAKDEEINSQRTDSLNFVEPFSSANSKYIECPNSVSLNINLCSKNKDELLYEFIYAQNREFAYRAFEASNKLLPASKDESNDLDPVAANVSSLQNDLFVREEFAKRKHYLRFKERVVIFKFRAFQYLWKEDIRLLSLRKNRAKYQKRFEYSSRFSHGGFQKHRASVLSRLYSRGNMTLMPTSKMIIFTSKLLSDSQVKLFKSTSKTPDLILDKKEKSASMFMSSNGLIEDPHGIEKERAMINPWTSQEKKIFMDNLDAFGKDFRKIASFLDHKTTADCVEFYYKNHKSDSFQRIKKPMLKKQNTFMLTSRQKWNREVNSASLDLLGEASVIAANADAVSAENKRFCFKKFLSGRSRKLVTSEDNNFISEKSNERETEAADVLAGICGSLSSEAMSSCITSSMDLGECYQDWKYAKAGPTQKNSLKPEVDLIDEENSYSDESSGELEPSDWTDYEKGIFIQALSSYGKDFKKISRCVKTRSRDQCKIFFSKARKCLELDLILCGPVNNSRSCGSNGVDDDDANGGGRSDTDDASCIVETGPVILSNEKFVSKIDLDDCNVNKSEGKIGIKENDLIVSKVGPDTSPVYEAVVQEDIVLSTSTKVDTENLNKLEIPIGGTNEPCTAQSASAVQTQDLTEESGICDQTELKKEEISLLQACKEEENVGAPLMENFHSNPLSVSKENYFPIKSFLSEDSAFIQNDKNIQDVKSSNLGLEEIRNGKSQNPNPITVNDCYQHLVGHPISNHVESSQILRGYALQIPDSNNSMKSHSSRIELHLLPQNLEQKNYHHRRVHSQSSSDSERQCKKGDVKLFGQILGQPSKSHEYEDKLQHNHFFNRELDFSKFDQKNYSGFENFSRSYGFLEGQMRKTVFSPPAAFSTHQGHQPLQVMGNLNGANGVSDCHVYTNQNGNKSQPLMQHRQDLMQRVNGHDGVIVGYVGEARPAVSDPVAAIKMHYAKAEQYNGQIGNFIREGSSSSSIMER